MMTVVPTSRIAPTEGNIPLRTFQNRAHSDGSVEKRIGSNVGTSDSAASMARTCFASPPALAARVSTNSAAPSAPSV